MLRTIESGLDWKLKKKLDSDWHHMCVLKIHPVLHVSDHQPAVVVIPSDSDSYDMHK